MNKLTEALEELIVNTANQYGGFEGFDDETKYDLDKSRNKIVAWIDKEIIGDELSTADIDPLTSPRSFEGRTIENKLKAKMRRKIGR